MLIWSWRTADRFAAHRSLAGCGEAGKRKSNESSALSTRQMGRRQDKLFGGDAVLVPKGLNSFVLSCHESRIQISCAGSQARGTLDTPSFFLNIVDDMIPPRRYKSEDRLYRRGLSRLEMASNRVGCNGRREARRRTDKNKTKNQRLKQPIKVASLAAATTVFSPSESSSRRSAPFVLHS
jgi:hypothetical protein